MNQNGIVSLISVGVVAILILGITVATSSLMIGEFRQSIDNSDSIAAYYAAYSGDEESYAMVSAANATNTPLALLQHDCSQNPSIQSFLPDLSNASGGVGHACRVIQAVTQDPKGTILVDKVQQYNLTFGSGIAVASKYISKIDFTWDTKGGGAGPPPVIFTIVSYPKDKGPVAPEIRSLILRPGGGSTSANFNSRTSFPVTIITSTPCLGTSPDRCTISLDNLLTGLPSSPATYDTILRLRPIGNDITYSLKAYDEGGTQLKVSLPQIYTDMTSRAGDTFSRLSNSIPVQSKPLSILDNVIFGNNSICKDFEVFTDNAGYQKIQVGQAPGGCQLQNISQE